MASIQGSNQSPIITQRYLNTEAYTGDPSPGAVVSTASVSGSIVQPYSGLLGGILTLSPTEALGYSDPAATQPLQAGQYQYVRFYSSSSGTNAPGQVVFWNPPASYAASNVTPYVVTPDAAATNGDIAGVTLGTPTKGNYWWMQISGIAAVKYNATVTVATPVVGDVISLKSATDNTADDPTQSGSPTYANIKLVLGVSVQAGVAAAIKLVRLGYMSSAPKQF